MILLGFFLIILGISTVNGFDITNVNFQRLTVARSMIFLGLICIFAGAAMQMSSLLSMGM